MKILYYIFGLNIGGAESFIYTVLSNINTEKYKIGFVLQSRKNENTKLLELCAAKGIKIHYIPPFHKAPIKSISETVRIIRKYHYDLIHIHQNAMINTGAIIAAKKCRIPAIMHSHNSKSNAGMIGKVIHKFNRNIYAVGLIRLSCGEEAGKWMYGDLNFKIVSNAISLGQYNYAEAYRQEIRNRLNVGADKKIVGHIGRFVPAKNHDRILDIFKELCKTDDSVILLLLGDGELKQHIEERIKQESLQGKVILTGNVLDANKYYSAFDALLFPSLFEGLPFTLVEAQSAGLRCLVSDNVTKDVNVTNSIEYMSLNAPIQKWAEHLSKMLYENTDRKAIETIMNGSRFDSDKMISIVEKIYDNAYKKERI